MFWPFFRWSGRDSPEGLSCARVPLPKIIQKGGMKYGSGWGGCKWIFCRICLQVTAHTHPSHQSTINHLLAFATVSPLIGYYSDGGSKKKGGIAFWQLLQETWFHNSTQLCTLVAACPPPPWSRIPYCFNLTLNEWPINLTIGLPVI